MYGSSVPGTEFRVFKEPRTGTEKFRNREPKIRVQKAHFGALFGHFLSHLWVVSNLLLALTVKEELQGT